MVCHKQCKFGREYSSGGCSVPSGEELKTEFIMAGLYRKHASSFMLDEHQLYFNLQCYNYFCHGHTQEFPEGESGSFDFSGAH